MARWSCLRRTTHVGVLGLGMAMGLGMVAAPAARAQTSDGFRSPSGNIHCQYVTDPEGGSLRCGIGAITNRPPPRPRDCELDWGQAFEMSAGSRHAVRICHGDTVADPSLQVLPYGESWVRDGFTCTSLERGVNCRNARGAGFELSRGRQHLF